MTGIADAIEWHTSFLDPEESLRLLGECDVVALPYSPSKESSSAALRGALASGAPVAVTPVAIFEEAGAAVQRLPGLEPAAVARGLDLLLRDGAERRHLQLEGARWLLDRSWSALGQRMRGMLAGLHASR